MGAEYLILESETVSWMGSDWDKQNQGQDHMGKFKTGKTSE